MYIKIFYFWYVCLNKWKTFIRILIEDEEILLNFGCSQSLQKPKDIEEQQN